MITYCGKLDGRKLMLCASVGAGMFNNEYVHVSVMSVKLCSCSSVGGKCPMGICIQAD